MRGGGDHNWNDSSALGGRASGAGAEIEKSGDPRQVALCEAVYTKTTEVEGLRAVRTDRYEEAEAVWQENSVPILIDPKGKPIER